jgi:hypothetical protein
MVHELDHIKSGRAQEAAADRLVLEWGFAAELDAFMREDRA